MNNDRRFDEDETRKIFERAGSPDGATRRSEESSSGLTLLELQAIGEEVGLSPARIADAAAALTLPAAANDRKRLGMPVSVARTMSLPRLPTDDEWELLLADLRTTFGVQGRDTSTGNIREWTSGSLFAVIEPTAHGPRIRLGSSKPFAMLLSWAGIAWIVWGLLMLVAFTRTSDFGGGNAFIPPIAGAVGAATLVYNGKRLGKWARTCAVHMDHVLDRARIILAGEPKAIRSSE